MILTVAPVELTGIFPTACPLNCKKIPLLIVLPNKLLTTGVVLVAKSATNTELDCKVVISLFAVASPACIAVKLSLKP